MYKCSGRPGKTRSVVVVATAGTRPGAVVRIARGLERGPEGSTAMGAQGPRPGPRGGLDGRGGGEGGACAYEGRGSSEGNRHGSKLRDIPWNGSGRCAETGSPAGLGKMFVAGMGEGGRGDDTTLRIKISLSQMTGRVPQSEGQHVGRDPLALRGLPRQ